MLKLLALLAVYLAFASGACMEKDPPQGAEIPNLGCSCYSGFVGTDCAFDAKGTCEFSPVEALVTEKIATLTNSFIGNGRFFFSLNAFSKPARHFSQVALVGSDEVLPACTYPSSPYIVKGFDGEDCVDTFEGNFTADALVADCIFSASQFSNTVELTGSLELTAVDVVGTFHSQVITRNTHSSVEFILTLPTTFTVQTNDLTVTSQIALESAIIDQTYTADGDTATIRLLTSVQWPYQLFTITQEVANDMFSYSIMVPDNSECPLTEDSPCFQVWEIAITGIEGSGACALNDNFEYSFQYGCRESLSTPCPVSGQDSLDVLFTLESSNVCSQVELSTDVTASIMSYGDSDFSEERLAFLANTRLYFEITVESEISILDIQIPSIRVVTEGGSLNIVSTGEPVSLLLSYTEDGFGNTIRFSFIAVTGDPLEGFIIFDTTSGDEVYSFTLEADIIVTYGVTLKRGFDTKGFKVSQQLVLQKSAVQPKDNAATSVTFNAGSLVAAALVGAVALI